MFRYGLSITFFIIIGDQLDRCESDRNGRFFNGFHYPMI